MYFQTFVCLCVSLFLKQKSQELCGDIWDSLGALTPRPDLPESSATPQATWHAYWATGLRAWILPDNRREIIAWRFFKSLSHESGLPFYYWVKQKGAPSFPFKNQCAQSVGEFVIIYMSFHWDYIHQLREFLWASTTHLFRDQIWKWRSVRGIVSPLFAS